MLMSTSGKITRIEEVLVGVFGAFIGGDFLMSQINGPTAVSSMSASTVGMAVAGAAVMLVLLRLMRGVVGPMRNSKSRAKQR
ncbi:MAG: hypothetical protein JWQ76_3554 [Ramlibacter sp.]|nr:hypothetical protein [Ramlibacter sp.]